MAGKFTVVGTGSTGKQGGAIARGLLERGHKVRAVTRHFNSNQAKSLATFHDFESWAKAQDWNALLKSA